MVDFICHIVYLLSSPQKLPDLDIDSCHLSDPKALINLTNLSKLVKYQLHYASNYLAWLTSITNYCAGCNYVL